MNRLTSIKGTLSNIFKFFQGFFEEPEKEPLTAYEVLSSGGMAPEESYYAGLPARLKDYYKGEALIKMYRALQKYNGEEAASSFKKLVKEMPDLAPSKFISAVKFLSKNNWNYSEFALNISPRFFGEDPEINYAIALGMSAAILGDYADETGQIKTAFEQLISE